MIVLKIVLGLFLFLFVSIWCIIIISLGIATGIKLSKGGKNGFKRS